MTDFTNLRAADATAGSSRLARHLAERYGIQSIPNIILFEDGAPKAQTIGAQPKRALERALGLAA